MNSSRNKPTRERDGVILYYLHRMSAWLYAWILHSFFGRLLTGYRHTRTTMSEGRLYRLTQSRRKRSDRLLFRFRHWLAGTLENSLFCRLVGALERALLLTSMNTYGIFFLFFGCYSVVTYYVLDNISPEKNSLAYLLTGGILILASLPLFASSRSLACGLRRSTILRFLVVRVFGIAEERLASYGDAGKEHYLESLIFAIFAGSFTFFVPPYRLLLALGGILLLLMIFRDPEIGMILSIGIAPFLTLTAHPTLLLLAVVGVSLFAYIIKLLCGKRVLRMEAMDWMILLLLALFLFGGIATHGGTASLYSALSYVCLGSMYFMVANLVRSQEGVYRMMFVLLISGAVVSLLGIWQYVFSTPALEYLDLRLFSDLGGRVSSVWENPNMLAEYLVLLIPMALTMLLLQRRLLRGFGGVLCLAALSVCLVFTWSRGSWLGILIALLLYVLCLHHRAFSWMLIGVLPICALMPYSPDTVARRFASIASQTDSSILYRTYLWQGVQDMLRDHWLTGVGVGERAFCTVYANYAFSGIETAMHSHSLYLQLLCSLGIVGLLAFAVTMFLWLQRALEYYRYGQLRGPRLIVLAGTAGIGALLIMGLFDEIWYNYRIFMLFWVVMGLVTAQVRIGERETERAYNPVNDERTQGEVVFRFN